MSDFIVCDFSTDTGHCLYGRVLPDGSLYFMDEKEFTEFPDRLRGLSGVVELKEPASK